MPGADEADAGHASEATGAVDGSRTAEPADDAEASHDADASETETADRPEIHVTSDLLTVLLEQAETAEPESVNIVLAATPAGDFETDLGVAPETPVLTHFYFPDAGGPVSSVFGIDLGTPAGRGRARFVTHPQGPLALTRRDDLAAVVLVAVPPWERRTLAAFDRNGREVRLRVVDAEPPQERLA